MDKLLSWSLEIERAIRYLLTGAIVCLIWILCLNQYNREYTIGWCERNTAVCAVAAIVVGAASYSLYRMTAWCLCDYAAWMLGFSAPSDNIYFGFERRCGCEFSYSEPYAQFLVDRYSSYFSKSISDYLFYRWSVAHFTFLFGIALIIGRVVCEDKSFIQTNGLHAVGLATFCIVMACFQICFLYRLERDYIRILRRDNPILRSPGEGI